jgi:hypothetical protein
LCKKINISEIRRKSIMADISSISAALSSVKTAIDIVKIIRESEASFEKAEMKLQLAELMNSLAETKMNLSEIQDTVKDKEERIAELENALEMKGKIVREDEVYFMCNDEGQPIGDPLCPYCIEVNSKFVHLVQNTRPTNLSRCPNCNNIFKYKASI